MQQTASSLLIGACFFLCSCQMTTSSSGKLHFDVGDGSNVIATGNASSGGIVGNSNSGNIEKCTSLNNSIIGTAGKTARIVGNLTGSATATNNAANINMLVNSSTVANSNKDGIGINPVLLTESIYTGTGTLTANTSGAITSGGLGWDPNIWDFTSRYPKLE